MYLLGVFIGSVIGTLLMLVIAGWVEARCETMTEAYARRKLYGDC
jgi:hypothetical protein